MRLALIVFVIAASSSVAAEKRKPRTAKFQKKLVPTGYEWQCFRVQHQVAGAVTSACTRTAERCEDTRDTIVDMAWRTGECTTQRNAKAVTYFDEMQDGWALRVTDSTAHCRHARKLLLANKDVRGVSKCRRVTSLKRKPGLDPATDDLPDEIKDAIE